eukprot:2461629-Amphidinium_carterae.1
MDLDSSPPGAGPAPTQLLTADFPAVTEAAGPAGYPGTTDSTMGASGPDGHPATTVHSAALPPLIGEQEPHPGTTDSPWGHQVLMVTQPPRCTVLPSPHSLESRNHILPLTK